MKSEKRKVEKPVVNWASANGLTSRKMNGLGFNHWPDRMFMLPGGRPIFIEFKAPGSGSAQTPMQKELMAELIDLGYECYVTDSKTTAIGILSKAMATREVPKARGQVPTRARGGRAATRSRSTKDE